MDEAAILVPGGGSPVQLLDLVRMLPGQAAAERIGEEVMVAVPMTILIEGHDEKVGSFQPLELRLTTDVAGDRVAEGASETIEDRGLQEEMPRLHGLTLQHLLAEIVKDVTMAAREPGDELVGVGVSLKAEGGELIAGHPSLGPFRKGGEPGIRERKPPGDPQERCSLVGSEVDDVLAQLGHEPACPQRGQRQGRVSPRRDHQVDLRWQVLEQRSHVSVNLRRVDDVVVVEQDDELRGASDQLANQGDGYRRRGRAARRGHGNVLLHTRPHRGDRRDHVAPEADRVVVIRLEKQPCDPPVGLAGPRGQQG